MIFPTQLTTFLAALAATASASPLTPRQIAIPDNWTWHVTNSDMGCSRGGCSYNFNVTVPTIPNEILGVKAYCYGREDGYDTNSANHFRACQILEGVNNGVAARFSQRNGGISPERIEVSFLFAGYEDRPAYNFTGSNVTNYNAAVRPQQEFDITPTQVWGIA